MNIKKNETIIEFDKIKELWMSLAMTDASKNQIKEMTPYLSEMELLTKLSVDELLAVEKALTAITRMKQYLKRGTVYDIPLAYYEENLEPMEDVREAIAVFYWK